MLFESIKGLRDEQMVGENCQPLELQYK